MFIRYYIELPLPVANVEQALTGSPAGWLSAVAGEAQARGDGLLGEIGVGPLGARLRRQVRIRLGEPVRFPSMTSLPLTWEPVGLEGLLPRLDANLELGSLGGDRTQLAMSARYRPPRSRRPGRRPGPAAPGRRGDREGLPRSGRPGNHVSGHDRAGDGRRS
jgi:hypothetical protein